MNLTADILKGILPHITAANIDKWLPLLQEILPAYDINTPQRLGGYLAQVGEESESFAAVIEDDSGEEYNGRKDLGNTQPGDGPRFKGRGPIQITGRNNYEWCSKDLFNDDRLVKDPTLLEDPATGVKASCWFWTVVKPLNKVCDHPEDWTTVFKGKTYTKIMWLTLLINGGENGLPVREANYARARQILNF